MLHTFKHCLFDYWSNITHELHLLKKTFTCLYIMKLFPMCIRIFKKTYLCRNDL